MGDRRRDRLRAGGANEIFHVVAEDQNMAGALEAVKLMLCSQGEGGGKRRRLLFTMLTGMVAAGYYPSDLQTNSYRRCRSGAVIWKMHCD